MSMNLESLSWPVFVFGCSVFGEFNNSWISGKLPLMLVVFY